MLIVLAIAGALVIGIAAGYIVCDVRIDRKYKLKVKEIPNEKSRHRPASEKIQQRHYLGTNGSLFIRRQKDVTSF